MDNFDKMQDVAAYKRSLEVSNTNPNLAPYEEATRSEQRVKIQNVWMDAQYVPEYAPDGLIDADGFYQVQAFNESIPIVRKVTSLELTLVDGTRATFMDDLLLNAIPHDFGHGYQHTLVDSVGNVVPFGLGAWVVDGYSGTLSFLGGVPEGYSGAFRLTFWRYCGRTGPGRILFNDGTSKMVSGYVPQYNKSVADKEYVDKSAAALEARIQIVTPNRPATFEGVALVVSSPGSFDAQHLVDDQAWSVTFSDRTITVDVPTFYNPETGIVSLMVNGVAADSIDLTVEPVAGTQAGAKGLFSIEKSGYLDDIRVYKKIKLSASFKKQDLPAEVQDKTRLEITMRYALGQDFHYSAVAHVGIEDADVLGDGLYGVVSAIRASDLISLNRRISGVPALTDGDSMTLAFSAFPYCNYKVDGRPFAVERHLTLGTFAEDLPAREYPGLQPTLAVTRSIAVPTGRYQESLDFEVQCGKVDGSGDHPTYGYSLPIRVDSVSRETIRVSSGWGLYPVAFGSTYPSDESLALNEELQLINGRFRWPAGNYSGNGVFVGHAVTNFVQAKGPNYDELPATGTRWATFKFPIPVCNGAMVRILGLTGAVEDPETHALSNVAVYAKVSNWTPWMDVNGCFDGVSPAKADGDPCMVVWDSSLASKRVTFGKKAVGGTILVRIGLTSGSGATFTGVEVEPMR